MDTLFEELVYNVSLSFKFPANKKSLPKHFRRDDFVWFMGIPVRTMGDKKAVPLRLLYRIKFVIGRRGFSGWVMPAALPVSMHWSSHAMLRPSSFMTAQPSSS